MNRQHHEKRLLEALEIMSIEQALNYRRKEAGLVLRVSQASLGKLIAEWSPDGDFPPHALESVMIDGIAWIPHCALVDWLERNATYARRVE